MAGRRDPDSGSQGHAAQPEQTAGVRTPAGAAARDAVVQQPWREDAAVNTAPAADPEPADAPALARLLAHDARTPLSAIHGFTELMLTGGAGPLTADALAYLAQVARAGRAIEEALRVAQELAEPAVGEEPRRRAPVDLAGLLRGLEFTVKAGHRSGPAAIVPGDEVAWAGACRACRACRAYLAGSAADAATLEARLSSKRGGGLELLLHRSDMQAVDGTRLLDIELARRLVARQGGRLTLSESRAVRIVWPVGRDGGRKGGAEDPAWGSIAAATGA
jgi:hypothetical protein